MFMKHLSDKQSVPKYAMKVNSQFILEIWTTMKINSPFVMEFIITKNASRSPIFS